MRKIIYLKALILLYGQGTAFASWEDVNWEMAFILVSGAKITRTNQEICYEKPERISAAKGIGFPTLLLSRSHIVFPMNAHMPGIEPSELVSLEMTMTFDQFLTNVKKLGVLVEVGPIIRAEDKTLSASEPEPMIVQETVLAPPKKFRSKFCCL
jgi:hypothetical protein